MFFIIIILLIGLGCYFLNFQIKKIKFDLRKNKFKIIERLKQNGILVEVETKDCEVIRNDRIVKAGIYETADIDGFKYVRYNKHHTKDKLEKMSILFCKKFEKGNQIKYIKYINMDSTILEYRLRIQDKISIYEDRKDSSIYYIDLNFLNN